MVIRRRIKLHSATQITNDIDLETIKSKIKSIPNAEIQEKLNRNQFNIIKINLETNESEDIDSFIRELGKIIRDHGIKRSSIEINEKIEIINE